MTIIKLNEEGLPRKESSTFPSWMIATHVGVISVVFFTMLIGGF